LRQGDFGTLRQGDLATMRKYMRKKDVRKRKVRHCEDTKS